MPDDSRVPYPDSTSRPTCTLPDAPKRAEEIRNEPDYSALSSGTAALSASFACLDHLLVYKNKTSTVHCCLEVRFEHLEERNPQRDGEVLCCCTGGCIDLVAFGCARPRAEPSPVR